MAQRILIILNNGPEDPGRVTAAFMAAKGLAEKEHDISIFLLNNAVYLMVEGTAEYVQAAGFPPFEDFFLFLTTHKKIPIYMGASCAIGRGLCDEKWNPSAELSYGEIVGGDKLTELIVDADKVITF